MTFASGNHPGSTPIRTTFASTLTAAGLAQVTANYSPQANWTIDVWKSSATSNAAGQDWYLIIADAISGASRTIWTSVCEVWDDASKTATHYIPATNNIVPAADFSVGSGAVAPTNTNLYYTSPGNWTDTVGTTYKISATPDRVVISFGGVPNYIGQIDRMYPVTQDPAGLITMTLGPNGSSSAFVGGATREPGQTVASAYNFRVQITTNYYSLFHANMTGQADPITGKALLSPVVVASSRQVVPPSRRGLLKDTRCIGQGTTCLSSDTATEAQADGTTRVFYNASAGYGIFTAQL